MKRTNIYVTAAVGVLWILFTGISCLMVQNKTGVFWISYAFVTAAFLAQVFVPVLSGTGKSERIQVMGLSFVVINVFYLLAALIAGVVFMILRTAPVKTAVIVQALVLGIYLVLTFFMFAGKEHIANVENDIAGTTALFRNLITKAEALYNEQTDFQIKSEMKKIYEALRYSYPVSKSKEALDFDNEIYRRLSALEQSLKNKGISDIQNEVKDIIDVINRRSRQVQSDKG